MTNTKRKPSVRALTPDDWDVVTRLFGDNGACGGCWCMHWRVPRGGKLWEEKKGEQNRRSLRKLVRDGSVNACVAFDDGGAPVGWCTFGPRRDFPRLATVRALRDVSGEDDWAVVCFFVKSSARKGGVGTALLRAAADLARSAGARSLEGYPVKPYRTGDVPAAFAWTGVPAVFERAGFRDATPAGGARPIYRRDLRRKPKR
jgi:GNAT superfamily N-acetyltransferase